MHLNWNACLIVALVSTVGACATTAAPPAPHSLGAAAGDPNAARVYLLRPNVGYFGIEGLAVSILIDGEKPLSLAKGEYAMIPVRPGDTTVTVSSFQVRDEFGKTVTRKVQESARFMFEAGKTHHIALCKQSRSSRAAPTVYYVGALPIQERYAQAGARALKPSGNAVQEPLVAAEPIDPTEAHRLLKDVCVAADNLWWYAGLIGRDCARVARTPPMAGEDDAASPAKSCEKVEAACGDRARSSECMALVKSYDRMRQGTGYSLLMDVAHTRIPRRREKLTDSGDTAAMRFLLDIGFDPNARVGGAPEDAVLNLLVPGYLERTKGGGWRDVTPLMIATIAGDRPMVRLLLAAGANPNAQNDQGRTALMYAAGPMTKLGEHFAGIATDLLNAGADPEVQSWSDSGTNALMFAAHHGRADIVGILLARGANPDAAGSDFPGATALMYAANNGHAEIVRMLLNGGANPALADRQGRTALAIAESNGHSEVVQVLKARSK